jgi:hypothetical protein
VFLFICCIARRCVVGCFFLIRDIIVSASDMPLRSGLHNLYISIDRE